MDEVSGKKNTLLLYSVHEPRLTVSFILGAWWHQ